MRSAIINWFAFVTIFSTTLWAQIDMGGVTGTIKDPSGAVVAGAQLTLTNGATGVTQKLRSSSGGSYVFEAVPIGSYTLKVEASGFKTYQATGIQVHVQNVVTVDFSLEVGPVSSVVSHFGSAAVASAGCFIRADDLSGVSQRFSAEWP